jgi:hypothetical protein
MGGIVIILAMKNTAHPLHSLLRETRNATRQTLHGRRGTYLSKPISIRDAAKKFAKARTTIHRWLNAGLLQRCDNEGNYDPAAQYLWMADVAKLASDPERKQGQPLNPIKKRKPKTTKFQRMKNDPEWSKGERDHWLSLAGKLTKSLRQFSDISTLRDDERDAIANALQPIADICAAMRRR